MVFTCKSQHNDTRTLWVFVRLLLDGSYNVIDDLLGGYKVCKPDILMEKFFYFYFY